MKPAARAYIAVWTRATLFRRFTDTNVYETGSITTRKTRHKMSVDIRIFLQCRKTETRLSERITKPIPQIRWRISKGIRQICCDRAPVKAMNIICRSLMLHYDVQSACIDEFEAQRPCFSPSRSEIWNSSTDLFLQTCSGLQTPVQGHHFVQ